MNSLRIGEPFPPLLFLSFAKISPPIICLGDKFAHCLFSLFPFWCFDRLFFLRNSSVFPLLLPLLSADVAPPLALNSAISFNFRQGNSSHIRLRFVARSLLKIVLCRLSVKSLSENSLPKGPLFFHHSPRLIASWPFDIEFSVCNPYPLDYSTAWRVYEIIGVRPQFFYSPSIFSIPSTLLPSHSAPEESLIVSCTALHYL